MRTIYFFVILLATGPGFVKAQQLKHSLLIGISQYPAPWSKIHGKEDVEALSLKLKNCGFDPVNTHTLVEKDATHQNITLQFRKLKEKVQPGDMVYIHFSGHFQRIADQNQDEDDGMDEAFIPYDALPSPTATYSGQNHLLDEQIGGLLKQIQEKITLAGSLFVSFDGGFSKNPEAGKRGTQQVIGSPTLQPSAEGYDNEMCDIRFDDTYRIAILEACNDCETVKEVTVDGKPMGSLTAALIELIETGKSNIRVRDAEKQLNAIASKLNASAPKIDGSNKAMPFFIQNEAPDTDFNLTDLKDNSNGKVYAVVIGVSEYINIPKLKYANSDAYKFYRILHHSFGKRMATDSNFVFLDMNATIRPIERALRKVVEQVKEGDRVYIYFAGHGDVEESVTRRGHLLLFDTPKHVYEEGSTLRLDRLREYVMEYVSRKARVFLVMDACHAGQLAGGDDGKSQNLLALKELSTHSAKVLSCQPNEKSLESGDYGGGSGVFTFYLIEGLSGRANQDGDQLLSLGELRTYLSYSVGSATDKKQNPMVEGNARLPFMPLTRQAEFISEIKPAQIQLLASRSIEVINDAGKDTLKARLEKLFVNQIKDGNLVAPSNACARLTYEKYKDLFAQDGASISKLKNKLTDALATKNQGVVNNYIAAAEGYSEERIFALAAQETAFLQDLVGYRDNNYFQYEARKHFFEGRSISANMVGNDLSRPKALEAITNLQKALKVEPNKANVHNALGRLYFYVEDYESALRHLQLAHSLAPTWKYPLNNLGGVYDEFAMAKKSKAMSDSALKYLQRVTAIYPDYALAWKNLGKVYENRGNDNMAKFAYKTSIFRKVDLPEPYINLGTLYQREQKWDSSSYYFKAGLALQPNNPDLLTSFGGMHYEWAKAEPANKTAKLKQATSLLTTSYKLDSNLIFTSENLANTYWEKQKFDSAARFYAVCVKLDSSNTDYREYEIEALLKAKQYDKALSKAKSNQLRLPAMGAFIFHEGIVLAAKKQWEIAAQKMNKGLDMGYEYNTDVIETDANLLAFRKSKFFTTLKTRLKK